MQQWLVSEGAGRKTYGLAVSSESRRLAESRARHVTWWNIPGFDVADVRMFTCEDVVRHFASTFYARDEHMRPFTMYSYMP